MNTQYTKNDLSKWLPSRGNAIFNLLLVGMLMWVQSAGAINGLASAARAASSTNIINYQGYLADNNGEPVNGSIDMTFRVYNTATGGTPLWQETWSEANAISVSDGIFDVALGDINATLAEIAQGQSDLYLGVTVGTSELTPRTKFGSAFNAVQALTVPAGSITSSELADNGIMTNDLADDSVTSAKLADNSVGSAQLANSGVGTADLANGSVTSAKLASNSVGSTQLTDGSVATADLANSSVTSAKLASNSVTSSQLAANSVTSADLANGSVTSAKLASNSVGSAQLANGSVTADKVNADVLERYPFHAYSSANTTISSDTTVSFFETADPENVFSNSQTFTAPRSGYYFFDTTISFDGGDGADDSIDFSFSRNGSLVNTMRINPRRWTRTGAEITESNSMIIFLNSGNTVSVRITNLGSNIRLKTRTLSGFYLGQ